MNLIKSPLHLMDKGTSHYNHLVYNTWSVYECTKYLHDMIKERFTKTSVQCIQYVLQAFKIQETPMKV